MARGSESVRGLEQGSVRTRLNTAGIDPSRIRSEQRISSGHLSERESNCMGNGRTDLVSVSVIGTRLAHNQKYVRLAAVTAVVLLASALVAVFTPWPVPSIQHSSRVSTLLDPLWVAEGNLNNAHFGTSVSSAGDVNGDGYDDVIVGAPDYSNDQTYEGRAFLYLGSASGPSELPSWAAEGDQDMAGFGYSVSSAGDVNNDGYDDVIIGAPDYSNGQVLEGRAYLYLGSSSGLSASPSWTAEGNRDCAQFGCSVSSAGNVNGDLYDDVVIGAHDYSGGGAGAGCAFLFLGSVSGLTSPSWIALGDQTGEDLGRSVSSAGDVNGDGYDDVIVGAPGYLIDQGAEGRAFVYLGSVTGLSASPSWTADGNMVLAFFGFSVSSAGDVNNDGFDDVVVGATYYSNGQTYEGCAFLYLGSILGLSGSPSWAVEGNMDFAYFGTSVSSAGDVNGDGYDDVIVGAPDYSNGQTYEGRVFLYFGSSSGLSASPSWVAESDQAYGGMGLSVSSAGDVNGDGCDDVIIGAPGYTNGEGAEGRAYLYSGEVQIPEFGMLLVPLLGTIAIALVLLRTRSRR
jgi:hypothetical protein